MQQGLYRTARLFIAIALLALPGWATAALVDAIEYYHAGLDHYFVTANPDEIAHLDAGYFSGWQRTGQQFTVGDPAAPLPGGSPVCRFYGNPLFGLDSHFYSASPAECAAVLQNFPDAWQLEAYNVFQVYLPDALTGACPAGTVPIYRAWNGRSDSNHRYTTSASIQAAMIAKGYVAEGYGSPSMPVAMCSPVSADSGTGAVPSCTLSANSTQPTVGNNIVIVANCTGSPTSYAWSGCTSSSYSCTTTSSTPGVLTYSLVASNGNGSSPPATIDIGWRSTSVNLPPASCNLSATSSSDPPTVGSSVVLIASCSNNPTSYQWTGCFSTTNTCVVSESAPGPRTYTVVAINEGGASNPVSLSMDWVSGTQTAPGFCSTYPAVLRSSVPWANTQINTAMYQDPPGFAWNGVWVVRITVPTNATATQLGRIYVAEYFGPPVSREVTLSRSPCDFRALDATGNNGPLLWAGGVSAGGPIGLGTSSGGAANLQPGQTYYVNVRNRTPDGSISCSEAQGRCDAFLNVTVPR